MCEIFNCGYHHNLQHSAFVRTRIKFIYSYQLSGEVLNRAKEEKDLGVIVTDNFKIGKQCLKA